MVKIYMLFIVLIAFPAHGSDRLESIKHGCRDYDYGIIKEFGFGEIGSRSEEKGEETDYFVKRKYGHNYTKRSDGYEKIGFYTKLKNNHSGRNPTNIWHVIAIPSEQQSRIPTRAYMNSSTLENSVLSKFISQHEADYLDDKHAYMTVEGKDYYSHNSMSDDEIKIHVNAIWTKMVKKRFVKLSHEKIESIFYDVWFYNYPILKSPDTFKTDGYLIPSTKNIKRRGKIYGFVLDDNRKCIGFKVLNVD